MFKKFTNGIIFLVHDLTLNKKLFLSYFVLIVLPMGLITYFSYQRSSQIVEEKMVQIAAQSMTQAANTISDKLEKAINISNMVSFNDDLQGILSRDTRDYSRYRQSEDVFKIRSILENLQETKYITRVKIYAKSEFEFTGENINLFSLNDIDQTEWYKKVVKNDGKIFWLSSHYFKYVDLGEKKNIISAFRLIKDYKKDGRDIGTISVDLPVEMLEEILLKNNVFSGGLLYLLDENNNNVLDSNDKLSLNNLNFTNGDWPGEGSEIRTDKGNYLLCSKEISLNDWKLVYLIPMDEILSSSRNIRNYSYMLMAVVGLISYFFASLISLSMTKRIKNLIKYMRKAKRGELYTQVVVEGKDEIGELQENFSEMLKRITILMDEKYEMGQELKNAELKALQAQINPHFLYNTLELINWRAHRKGAYDISFLISSLSKFYKLSLSKGKTIVSIADEVEHAETYINIQNKRFNNAITLEKEIEEELKGYSILKLVLQPLVENSVMHGILEKKNIKGTIMISANMAGSIISIQISDDGIGMSKEKLEELKRLETSSGKNGYGIGNVDKRIRMYYGEEYGLSFTSFPGQGTTVEIKIPAVKLQDVGKAAGIEQKDET